MFERLAAPVLRRRLSESPAVAILGARQVGKTTLARSVAGEYPDSVYIDLESAQGRARLAEPAAFFHANRDRLVVLDEIQNLPELFSELRGEIDADRRAGRFLVLGSASFKLLRQSQSLAGRLALVDMAPLLLAEVARGFEDIQTLWLRGGFPGSYTAADEAASWAWRESFVRHFLNTDLPALGIRVEPELMRRFWRMVAHLHGQLFNASAIANSLGLRAVDDLLGHPSTGASWEGFVVEQVCSRLDPASQVSFYRTAAGAELDLVVETGSRKIGIEVKFSSAPKVTKGFWQACEDVGVDRAYVVAPVREGWTMAANVEVVSPIDLPLQ